MTDNELDQLMQRVLLDAIKSDCEKENSVVPSFEPSLRYQRSLAAMIADPLKWAHKRTKPLWKKVLQKVAIVLIVFSLSLGSLMAVSPNIRAAVVNWVTEWYETHITFRYLGTPTEDEMPEYTIGALPNGYAEVDSEREEWPDYICIVYRNEVSGKTIYFDYTRMTQGYVNDFEVNSDTATSSVLVNGMQGYLFQEKNWERQRSSITWIDSDKNLQFTIHAYLPQSRILQMAESVSEILEMSRNVQSGNTQNLKSTVIQRSFPKWSVAERRKTAAASDQAAVCACAHSRYFAGGSPSGLRV